jgi:CRP-like cAMP-binding protein
MFQGIALDDLVALARQGRKCTFRAGSKLTWQGDPGQSVYIILKGHVRVERAHPDLLTPVVLAEMGAGEVVAGLGVLDGQPRSATVTAIEDTEALEVSARVLAELVVDSPNVSAALLHRLSRRLQSPPEPAERTSGNGREVPS